MVREDWKRNYELITAMDAWAGRLIAQLKEDGLYDNTIIFFWSDHGVGLPEPSVGCTIPARACR